jgi:hypothetical protein
LCLSDDKPDEVKQMSFIILSLFIGITLFC